MTETTKKRRISFRHGFWAGTPITLGVAPFALIYGIWAKSLNLDLWQTMAMSLGVFAGSAQYIFLDLWGQAVSPAVLIITCLIINLRMGMYGASLRLYTGPLNGPVGLAGVYLLTDEGYGSSVARFVSHKNFPYDYFYFYLGAALPTWLSWQSCSLAGFLAGSFLPESMPLDMAGYFVFLSLLLSMLAKGPKLAAASVSLLTAVIGAAIPMKLGLILAVFTGVAAGLTYEKYFMTQDNKEVQK